MSESARMAALARLARLFEYPDGCYRAILEGEAQALGPGTVGSTVAELVTRFLDDTAGWSEARFAEVFTRTFDLAPTCAPYLGVHLFGEEGSERSALLLGLQAAYRQAGLPRDSELPDHVAVVLRALGTLPRPEREELVALCLVPALESMRRRLDQSQSSYRHLVGAVAALAAAGDGPDEVPEGSHA